MKKLVLLFLFVATIAFSKAQILVTSSQVNAINTAQSASEGDIYKDTENNVFYIGTSSGILKIIGDVSKVDASLAGDGSVANPLRIAPMGAAAGQVLSWNGTSWVPVNVATGTTYMQNHSTTIVSGEGTIFNPYAIEARGATTTTRGIIQLAGDLTGNDYWPIIGDGKVTNAKLTDNAVTSSKIQDGSIATVDLGWGVVTTDKLSLASVTYDRIQQMPAQTLLGNPYSSAASPLQITLGTGLSFSGNVLNATGAGWSLTGNAGTAPATNFLGTTDNQRLVFRTNNVERATILTNGNFGLGLTAPAATFHNNGSSIFTIRVIGNKPTGGNIETAANSVDIGSIFHINQSTSGQILTLPSPTITTAGRMIKVSNIGTVSFKIANIVLAPSKFADFLWTGSDWIPAVAEIAPSLSNKTYVLSAEYAGAVLVPGSGVNHKGDMIGGNTGAVLPYYMNYYEWKGRSSGSQTYQVIVRITLPNDFTEWQSSAMNVTHYVNNSACNISFVLINTSTNTTFYTSPSLNSTSWTTNVINNTSLASWVTPGQTVAMVITFSATNGNVARFADIVLNYK